MTEYLFGISMRTALSALPAPESCRTHKLGERSEFQSTDFGSISLPLASSTRMRIRLTRLGSAAPPVLT